MRIASKWFSSFLATKPYEETEKEFVKELDSLQAMGADRINVSEQSYSVPVSYTHLEAKLKASVCSNFPQLI